MFDQTFAVNAAWRVNTKAGKEILILYKKQGKLGMFIYSFVGVFFIISTFLTLFLQFVMPEF